VKRFRGGLVIKAHRLLYHPTLGLRVVKKKKKKEAKKLDKDAAQEAVSKVLIRFPFTKHRTGFSPPL